MHTVRPFAATQPLVDMVISDFNPVDLTVELTLVDAYVTALEMEHAKPIADIDLLTAWLSSSVDGKNFDVEVTAFYFPAPNDPSEDDA